MLLFVGEKLSRTAEHKGWTWTSGRLAAKPLFEALVLAGIDPREQQFINLFQDDPDAPELPAMEKVDRLRRHVAEGGKVVAMGRKVQGWLGRLDIPHVHVRHPAARGAGRAKAVYAEHIRERLG